MRKYLRGGLLLGIGAAFVAFAIYVLLAQQPGWFKLYPEKKE